jgi:hypothetical protein
VRAVRTKRSARRKTELWESPDVAERWVETDPEKLAELTTEPTAPLPSKP